MNPQYLQQHSEFGGFSNSQDTISSFRPQPSQNGPVPHPGQAGVYYPNTQSPIMQSQMGTTQQPSTPQMPNQGHLQNSGPTMGHQETGHSFPHQLSSPSVPQQQPRPSMSPPQISGLPLSQPQAGPRASLPQNQTGLQYPQQHGPPLSQQQAQHPLPQHKSGSSYPEQPELSSSQQQPSMPQKQPGAPLPHQQSGPPLPHQSGSPHPQQQKPGTPTPQPQSGLSSSQPGPYFSQNQSGTTSLQQQSGTQHSQKQSGPQMPQQQTGYPIPQSQPGQLLSPKQSAPLLYQNQPGSPFAQQQAGVPYSPQQTGSQQKAESSYPQQLSGSPMLNQPPGPPMSQQLSGPPMPPYKQPGQLSQQQSRPPYPQHQPPMPAHNAGYPMPQQQAGSQILPSADSNHLQGHSLPQPPFGPPMVQGVNRPPLGGPHMPPQLQSHLAGMNISDPRMGGPPLQNNFAGSPPAIGNMSSSFPPAVNGMTPPDLISQGYMNDQRIHPPQPKVAQQEMYNHSGYNSYGPAQPGAYPGAQQPPKRLDPDHMPSPLEVMREDQKAKGGVFYTNQRGLMPPLVTTQFVVQDQGNCSPRFMRSTMYNVPVNTDIMKQAAVPFGLVISPLARTQGDEHTPPVVDMGDLGPVRCVRCKAYMCPFMQFIDGGRRFQCLFCKATSDVPEAYFQHLDHTGMRMDRYERPELMLGAYEFVATKEYCRNDQFPKPPALIFMIDVSYNNVKSGLVHLLCSQMKDILRKLPREPWAHRSSMRVGFVTYNNSVHFYNVKACLAQPQMMVVGDTNEMFMPLLDGFLVDPVESETVIDSLMDQIPQMFADTRETETILGPVVQAGMEALKAAECAGKLLIFHTSLPTAEAPGKLKNRDDRKLLATEKEKTVLNPQNNFYNSLAQECVGAGCSVDMYMLNNSYVDLATVGQVCRLTGGEVFKYTYFQASIDGERLIADIKYNVGRPVIFDAIMRVRTSTGVRPTDFFGHFFMSNTTDMELASMDCDKTVALEIKHDDKLTEEEGVYVQVALLHTSCSGQRRIRILNLALKTCSQMADLYRACELDSIMNFFGKQALYRLREHPPKQIKESLIIRCAMMLACYRKNCASPGSAGQLILPECMKLLPLYVSCLLKSDAISGGSDMTIDDRSFVMYTLNTMDIPSSVVYYYPRLIPLHDMQDTKSSDIPLPIRCSAEKLCEDGAYLLENGIHMFMWFGLALSAEWVQAVFGVPSVVQVNTDDSSLPDLDNPLSQRIRELVACIRIDRHRFMRLTLVRQHDKMEVVMKHFLVEDRGIDGSASYVDFLCHMHKEIRTILS